MYGKQRESLSHGEDRMIMDAKKKIVHTKDPLEKLRLLCLSRGGDGVISFGKIFRRMDDDKSHNLNLEEFSEGIRDSGLSLNEEEAEELYKAFDKDKQGSVDYNEFLLALRPKMNEGRLKLVDMAFDKLDKSDDGAVTMEDLKGKYSVQKNPGYLSGEKTEEQILNSFISRFEGNTASDGKLTKEEFYDYYAGISASIDHDAYFDLMMRNAWDLK